MRTIWKYALDSSDEQEIELPLESIILSAAFQDSQLVLWAMVDPHEQKREPRKLVLRGTGHPLRVGNLKFISTAFYNTRHQQLVFHLFEDIGPA